MFFQRVTSHINRAIPSFSVCLPPHLRQNIIPSTAPNCLVRKRWPIHTDVSLSDIVPPLCYAGKQMELAATILFHFLQCHEYQQRHFEISERKTNQTLAIQQQLEKFEIDLTGALILVLNKKNRGGELFLTLLNPALLQEISPGLESKLRVNLKNSLLRVFRRIIIVSPLLLYNINFNQLLHIVGLHHLFAFMERTGIPVVYLLKESYTLHYQQQHSISKTNATGRRHETMITESQSDYPFNNSLIIKPEFHTHSLLMSRLSPDTLHHLFMYYFSQALSDILCTGVRLALQLSYSDYYYMSLHTTLSSLNTSPQSCYEIYSLKTSLGGSPWNLQRILRIIIQYQATSPLLLLLKYVPNVNLFLDCLSILKEKHSETGCVISLWGLNKAKELVKCVREIIYFYVLNYKYAQLYGLKHLPTIFDPYRYPTRPETPQTLPLDELKESAFLLYELLQGKKEATIINSIWIKELVLRHSGDILKTGSITDVFHSHHISTTCHPLNQNILSSQIVSPSVPLFEAVPTLLPLNTETHMHTHYVSDDNTTPCENEPTHSPPTSGEYKAMKLFTRTRKIELLLQTYIVELSRLFTKEMTHRLSTDLNTTNHPPIDPQPMINITMDTIFEYLKIFMKQIKQSLNIADNYHANNFNYTQLFHLFQLQYNTLCHRHNPKEHSLPHTRPQKAHPWIWDTSNDSLTSTFTDMFSLSVIPSLTDNTSDYVARSVKELACPKVIEFASYDPTDPITTQTFHHSNCDESLPISLCWGSHMYPTYKKKKTQQIGLLPSYLYNNEFYLTLKKTMLILPLPLKKEHIFMITSLIDLKDLFTYFHDVNTIDIVGIDIEWSPPLSVSILTIVLPDRCYLIDFTTLDESPLYRKMLFYFFLWLLGAPHILKIFYQFKIDLSRIIIALLTDDIIKDIIKDAQFQLKDVSNKAAQKPMKQFVNILTNSIPKKLQNIIDLKGPRDYNFVMSTPIKDPESLFSTELLQLFKETNLNSFKKSLENLLIDTQQAETAPCLYQTTQKIKWDTLYHMIEDLFPGFILDRSGEFLNWNQRPLTDKHLRFAAMEGMILMLIEAGLRQNNLPPSVIIGYNPNLME